MKNAINKQYCFKFDKGAYNLLYTKETYKHITATIIYMTNIYFTKAKYNLTILQYIVYNSHLLVTINVLVASTIY